MNLDFINFFQPVLWIKIITLVVMGFYVIFTFVVFTQVKTMEQILHFPHDKTIFKVVSTIHIVLAISLFFGAFVIL